MSSIRGEEPSCSHGLSSVSGAFLNRRPMKNFSLPGLAALGGLGGFPGLPGFPGLAGLRGFSVPPASLRSIAVVYWTASAASSSHVCVENRSATLATAKPLASRSSTIRRWRSSSSGRLEPKRRRLSGLLRCSSWSR